jgi:glycosyltransferase involved in cell wall biosynthesis
MIAILHGYLLEGSGSNLWTRSVVRSMCRGGETVHLFCQEDRPERYDFISEAYSYDTAGERTTLLERNSPYAGRCVLHRPEIGDTLPVYVPDHYEGFAHVVPMTELSDQAIESYLDANVRVLERVVREQGVSVMHANHAVLMSVVAQRVGRATSVPFAVMPHGSAVEYAVKRDRRLAEMAACALGDARRIFIIGPELRERILRQFSSVPGLEDKMTELSLGVDTEQFEPVARRDRPDNIRRLAARLAAKPRGRTPEMRDALRAGLSAGLSLDALRTVCEASARYSLKSPDAGLESLLGELDWETAPTLLFVGRLIAAKGLPSVLAALPLIASEHPELRVFVVGHGPLREAMEAFLWALESGCRPLLERIVAGGQALEGGGPEPFEAVESFFARLRDEGRFDEYLALARDVLRPERVLFTGYLEHAELRLLFPCCDVAVFPSVVAEAGPLVFLEALASGCFPLGTYFGGMAASIDAVAAGLPREHAELMKIRKDARHTVRDIVTSVCGALSLAGEHRHSLREAAVNRYDWRFVTRKLVQELRGLAGTGTAASGGP